VRVVVIDDEPSILTAVVRMLGAGFEVRTFAAAPAALAAIVAETPEAILCDVMMPGMSGAEFWSRLEAAAPALLQRVVLLTGGAFTPQAQAFIESSRAPLVEKPFSTKALRDAVRSVANREPPPSAP
jgi:FixJ family two-component response regulator